MKKFSALVVSLAVIAAGCSSSDDNSGGSSAAPVMTITGKVSDPAV